MERVVSNLYRIGGEPDKGVQSHSYLLVRKTGNLFICHQSVPTPEDVKEIKQLGGIASQWVCHHHDANRKGRHDGLFKTFGCASRICHLKWTGRSLSPSCCRYIRRPR